MVLCGCYVSGMLTEARQAVFSLAYAGPTAVPRRYGGAMGDEGFTIYTTYDGEGGDSTFQNSFTRVSVCLGTPSPLSPPSPNLLSTSLNSASTASSFQHTLARAYVYVFLENTCATCFLLTSLTSLTTYPIPPPAHR